MLLPILAKITQIDCTLPPSSFVTYVPSTCNDLNNCRTITDIIWSCLATIFVCIWVGVHPNIPKPTKRKKYTRYTGWRDWFFNRLRGCWDDLRLIWWPPVWNRLMISIWALLTPEFILVWAIRQWFVACEIADDLQYATGPWKLAPAALERAKRRKQQMERIKEIRARATSAASAGGEVLARQALMSTSGTPREDGDIAGDRQSVDDKVPSTSKTPALTLVKGSITNIKVTTDTEWTMTHGFFVLMGGFHLFDDDEPLHPLDRWDVVEMIQNGFTCPSEDEIKDRSKGDALSKTIVLGQTVWFVAQCIARGVQGIAITELEIVTLAYTLIIVLMYGFWWNKPLCVEQPVRVQGKGHPPSVYPLTWWEIFKKWRDIFLGLHDGVADMSNELEIPAFYAGELDNPELFRTDLIAAIVAIFFGAIHCIAWSLQYPSHAEQLLWRIFSIAVVGGPGIWALFFLLVLIEDGLKINMDIWTAGPFILSVVAIPIYIIARVILLILAFTSLRSLPQAAYQTVTWTTFIPHI